MSKRTVVSDYIKNKLNNIKKDSFLEEISNYPFYRQRTLISEEISQIMNYISLIKENKNSYEVINHKKKLKPIIVGYIKSLKSIILKYQQYIKYLNLLNGYNNRQERINERIDFESSQTTISNNQLRLLDTITSNSIKNLSFNDLVNVCKYMTNNFELLDNHSMLFEILKEIMNRFIEDNYNEEKYISISSIKNILNYKITHLDKNDNLRKPLREMKKYVKSTLERSQSVHEKQHDYRCEIVEYLLENEYYFNRLLEEMPDIVNLTDKDGFSLVYNVISKYLDLYLLELQGKKTNDEKEKYARIYRKIISSSYYKNDRSTSYEVEVLINNFKDTIKNGKFKRDKYLRALNTLDNIGIEENEKHIENDLLDQQQLFFDIQNILKKDNNYNRIDLTEEDTIAIKTNQERYYNYAYSVSKDENNKHVLRVHITDIREFIKHDSELNKYLKNHMFFNNKNWLDDRLMNKLSLEENKVKPVLTFELKVLPTGKIESFKIYKSNIIVNNTYLMDEVHEMVKKHSLRFLPFLEISYFLNKDINKDNYGLSISNTFNSTILDMLGRYFEDNKLPYIYRIQDKQNAEIYMKNMTILNQLFTKISEEHFNCFYKIICEDTNYARYTNECRHHFLLNQKHYTDLFVPLYSYIGIHIQELINEFYFKNYPKEVLKLKKEIWEKENNYLIEHANAIREAKRIERHKEKIKVLKGSNNE